MENKISDEQLKGLITDYSGDEGSMWPAEICTELLQLRADALVSQQFQSNVLMPLFDDLEQAGYAGNWTEKVAAVLNPWVPVGDGEIQIGKLYYVINGGYASSATAVMTSWGIKWYHGSVAVEYVNVTHVIDPETMPLPQPMAVSE